MIAFAIIEPGAADLVLYPDGRSEHHPPGLGEIVIAQQAVLPQPARADVTDADLHAILQARRDEWLVRTAQELARRELEAVPGMGTPEGRRNNYLLRNPEPTLESLRAEFASQGASGATALVETVPNAWWMNLITPDAEEWRFLSRPGSLPRQAVARALSDLELDGWTVLDIVEARAVVHEAERSTTVVTGLHVTLQRHETT